MSPQLRALLVAAAVVSVGGGVALTAYVREPPSITIAELRDAGMDDVGTLMVLEVGEKVTRQTRRNFENLGYVLRPGQQYVWVARVVKVDVDAGWMIVPSARWGVPTDGGEGDGGEENVEVSLKVGDGRLVSCTGYQPRLPDGGTPYRKPDTSEAPFCTLGANRRGVAVSPFVIPNCWNLPDGGWNDEAVVDCLAGGPYGTQPGGTPRWAGCNRIPSEFSSGTACVPVVGEVNQGDPPDFL